MVRVTLPRCRTAGTDGWTVMGLIYRCTRLVGPSATSSPYLPTASGHATTVDNLQDNSLPDILIPFNRRVVLMPSAEPAPQPGESQYSVSDGDLDESYYVLEPSEQEFLSGQTGIKDPDELKKHVIEVQKGVYSVSKTF